MVHAQQHPPSLLTKHSPHQSLARQYSGFRIRMKEEGDDSGRAGRQKNGDMKQNECREIRGDKRKRRRPRPARTGSKKAMWGKQRSKNMFNRTPVQLSHCLRLQGQATAEPPCNHFAAQASINYQTSTLDIGRRLSCVRGHGWCSHRCCCRILVLGFHN